MTVPLVAVATIPLPSTLSVQFAPRSINAVPCVRVSDVFPLSVRRGAVVSTTIIVLVAVVKFHSSSVAVYCKIYVPGINVFIVPVTVTVHVVESIQV